MCPSVTKLKFTFHVCDITSERNVMGAESERNVQGTDISSERTYRGQTLQVRGINFVETDENKIHSIIITLFLNSVEK